MVIRVRVKSSVEAFAVLKQTRDLRWLKQKEVQGEIPALPSATSFLREKTNLLPDSVWG